MDIKDCVIGMKVSSYNPPGSVGTIVLIDESHELVGVDYNGWSCLEYPAVLTLYADPNIGSEGGDSPPCVPAGITAAVGVPAYEQRRWYSEEYRDLYNTAYTNALHSSFTTLFPDTETSYQKRSGYTYIIGAPFDGHDCDVHMHKYVGFTKTYQYCTICDKKVTGA